MLGKHSTHLAVCLGRDWALNRNVAVGIELAAL